MSKANKKAQKQQKPVADPEERPLLNNQEARPAARRQPSAAAASRGSFVEEQLHSFWQKYSVETPQRLKIIDAFILYLTSLIVWQLFYRIVSGTDFPKNAFLSGIFAPIGVIVMTVALRMQVSPNHEDRPNKASENRAFWEYLFGLLVLFVVIINFLG